MSWPLTAVAMGFSSLVSVSKSCTRGHQFESGLWRTLLRAVVCEHLLTLQTRIGVFDSRLPSDCLYLLRNTRRRAKTKVKKGGSIGGIRERLKKRGSQFPLPQITHWNVRSLNNKVHELMLRVGYEGDFKHCNLICLFETWLKEDTKWLHNY